MNSMFKPMAIAVAGMVSAVLEATVPMLILTATFVFVDAVTAYRLQIRLARAGKIEAEKVRISSARFGRVFVTIGKIFCLLILAAMADYLVLNSLGLQSLKFVAGAVCFWQTLSLLENEAAENRAEWARHARRYLVDKAKRYLSDK